MSTKRIVSFKEDIYNRTLYYTEKTLTFARMFSRLQPNSENEFEYCAGQFDYIVETLKDRLGKINVFQAPYLDTLIIEPLGLAEDMINCSKYTIFETRFVKYYKHEIITEDVPENLTIMMSKLTAILDTIKDSTEYKYFVQNDNYNKSEMCHFISRVETLLNKLYEIRLNILEYTENYMYKITKNVKCKMKEDSLANDDIDYEYINIGDLNIGNLLKEESSSHPNITYLIKKKNYSKEELVDYYNNIINKLYTEECIYKKNRYITKDGARELIRLSLLRYRLRLEGAKASDIDALDINYLDQYLSEEKCKFNTIRNLERGLYGLYSTQYIDLRAKQLKML